MSVAHPESSATLAEVPTEGQLVEVRGRRFVVAAVERSELDELAQHLLTLSSVEDDATGEELRVIWEIEPGARTIEHLAQGAVSKVLSRSTVFVWPADKRPKDQRGYAGVLHAKCALADSSILLVSSANLTESAMTSNIELGLLVRGGPLPGRVGAAFDRLRASGSLVAVS